MIAVGFFLLAVVLLALVVSPRVPWPALLALIVVVPLWAFLVYGALDSFEGYPTEGAPPAKSRLIASEVVEPSPDDPGRIFLWTVPPESPSVLGKDTDGYTPRAYAVPYSRPLHEQLEGAKQAQKALGQRFGVREGPRGEYRVYRLPPPGPGPKS